MSVYTKDDNLSSLEKGKRDWKMIRRNRRII